MTDLRLCIRVPGREVRLGDSINVPGDRLHEDLAGLSCVLQVDGLARVDKEEEGSRRGLRGPWRYDFKVWDSFSQSWTWFEDDEILDVYRPSDRRQG